MVLFFTFIKISFLLSNYLSEKLHKELRTNEHVWPYMNVSRQDTGPGVELQESSAHSIAWMNRRVNSVETDRRAYI